MRFPMTKKALGNAREGYRRRVVKELLRRGASAEVVRCHIPTARCLGVSRLTLQCAAVTPAG